MLLSFQHDVNMALELMTREMAPIKNRQSFLPKSYSHCNQVISSYSPAMLVLRTQKAVIVVNSFLPPFLPFSCTLLLLSLANLLLYSKTFILKELHFPSCLCFWVQSAP